MAVRRLRDRKVPAGPFVRTINDTPPDPSGNVDVAGGGGGASAAEDVTFTPAGGVAATDVQAALEELDTEKSDTGHDHDADYAATAHTHTATVGGTATFALNTPGVGLPPSAEGHELLHPESMWEIDANGAWCISIDTIFRALLYVDSDDMEVSWTIGALGSTSSQNDGGVYIRYQNSRNYYYLDLFNNSPRLIKVVNGTLSVIGNWSTVAANDVVYVSFVGNAYTVKKNGSTIGSGTDSGVTTGKYAGLKAPNNLTFRWKNLIITEL